MKNNPKNTRGRRGQVHNRLSGFSVKIWHPLEREVTFSSKVLIKEEEDFQGRIPSSLRCKHLEKPRFPLRRRHDSSMLPDSGLLRDLERHGFSTTRESMAVYGDPAYPLRVHLQFPYIGAGITPLLL